MLRAFARPAGIILALVASGCDEAPDAIDPSNTDAGDASSADVEATDVRDASSFDADYPCGPPPRYWCVSSCGTDYLEQPFCGDAGWACGAGKLRHDSCAPGTCFSLPFVCCRPDGSRAPHVCDTQSATAGCSEGSTRTWISTAPDPCIADAGSD